MTAITDYREETNVGLSYARNREDLREFSALNCIFAEPFGKRQPQSAQADDGNLRLPLTFCPPI
jgi:hypothetical protein